jgi:hypothetical protein
MEAAFLLPLVFVGLRTIGLVRMRRLLEPRASAADRHSVKEAHHVASLVEAVARRGPFRYNCLQRSLVLWRMLRRRGLQAELRIGVRREADGDRRFHAWVEHGGRVLNDTPHVRNWFSTFGPASIQREDA